MEVFEYTGKGQSVPRDVVSVRFHPSITEVEDAFRGCTQLREVEFNNGLKKIGWQTFLGCRRLQSITLPSTVTEIDDGAFWDCRNLREIGLHEGLQKIGGVAFRGCSSLRSIKLPSNVMEIGNFAFQYCSSLRAVVLNDGKWSTKIDSSVFYECSPQLRFIFANMSTRLESIIQAGLTEVVPKVERIRGPVQRSGSQMFVCASALNAGVSHFESRNWDDNWKAVNQRLPGIIKLITYYEMKEATTLFELALWKAKIDQIEESSNRDACRVEVPGPVKDVILQYL